MNYLFYFYYNILKLFKNNLIIFMDFLIYNKIYNKNKIIINILKKYKINIKNLNYLKKNNNLKINLNIKIKYILILKNY